MSTPPSESTISPAQREKLQQIFSHGSKQMAIASFDYANDMFVQCLLGDPGNVIYFKTFLANLKKKFGEKKKKGVFSFLSASNIKKTVAGSKPEQVFKATIGAVVADPWDAGALIAMGEACEGMGHHDVAIEYFRAAVEAEPGDPEVNRVCALALREIGAYDEAIACVLRLLKAKPGDQPAIKLQKDLAVEKTIHKGKYAMGDSKQVRETANQMKAGVPEDEDAMGRPLTYVEQVEKRIKKNPTDIANFLELAMFYYQAADYAKAEEYYLKAVEMTKSEPDMVERLLDTQKQKFLAHVIKLKEDFEKTKQASLKDEFYKAKEEYEAKNMELAKHRIQHHPNHAGYHFEYGVLLQQKGEIKDAITEFQQAKLDVTRKGECLLALGQCFQQIKQYKLAMTHYQEAVEALQDTGENKKKALYLATKLAFGLEEYDKAEKYGHQLAAIDFSYKDVGELLDKVAQKHHN